MMINITHIKLYDHNLRILLYTDLGQRSFNSAQNGNSNKTQVFSKAERLTTEKAF